MTFLAILHTLLIGPLKLLFESLFEIANRFINHPGLSIISLSLMMNILVLPLYMRADAMQEQARDMDRKLRAGVAHIKKTFSGDEKMMILQTYYRQNHYKPTDTLKGSVSLLLEIPFFIAAYQFLSGLESLQGVSLGPIQDLSRPDGLFTIGGTAFNVLPFIMTGINFLSSWIYLKGFPLKTKIQLYGMALFFLVFLYTSPSGLVFYWTLNNVFSLAKTLFYKLKNPKRVLSVLMAVFGIPALLYAVFFFHPDSLKKKGFLILLALILELPLLWSFVKTKIRLPQKHTPKDANPRLFLLGCIFLTILIGLLIPSTFIAESPQEYVDVTYFFNPLWYIVSSTALAAGTFLVWMRVFYWLAGPAGRPYFEGLTWILCGVATVDYMFFGTDLGIISSTLHYENKMIFSGKELLLNLAVLLLSVAALYVVLKKWQRLARAALLTASIALGVMSATHLIAIKKSIDTISPVDVSSAEVSFDLSTRGKNVVVIMLDRAMGEYIPYIMNEKPELRRQFAGFTYYSNVISFGPATNFAIPALLGGYEYTPVEMNRRKETPLVEKHNEALRVMPKLFADNKFDVTVCNPTYANYQWIPDLSIYDDLPGVTAYNTQGISGTPEYKQGVIDNNLRNFFCFGLMKTAPLFFQPTLYANGTYNQYTESYTGQFMENMSQARGLNPGFMDAYNVLSTLPYLTNVTDSDKNTFLFLANDITHEPLLLQEPEYIPAQTVDNRDYDAQNAHRFTIDDKTMHVDNVNQMSHYHVNMAALLQLGKWFDRMRQQGVYDNTRIILVSDHGRGLRHFDALFDASIDIEDLDSWKDAEPYYPLLMVKDFGSTEFSVSDAFMTNADVPLLATEELIENPVNPFTGNPLTDAEKYDHAQYIILSDKWQTGENNGNTFLPAAWACVKDDLWEKENWEFWDEEIVLDRHEFPDNLSEK